MLFKQSMWRSIGTCGALVVLLASPALAQRAAPDGSPVTREVAPRSVSKLICGRQEYSIAVADSAASSTTSTAFVPLPNASVEINVYGEETRCVKVLFTAETACSPTPAGDYCYVRALDNGRYISPGNKFQAIDSDHGTAQGHSFEWIHRVGPGKHTFTIEWRVRETPTSFFIDDWTFDVQVFDGPFGDGS